VRGEGVLGVVVGGVVLVVSCVVVFLLCVCVCDLFRVITLVTSLRSSIYKHTHL